MSQSSSNSVTVPLQQMILLRQQLQLLKEKHEITLLELADSHEQQQRLKNINDSLLQALKKPIQVEPMKDIALNITGEFTSQRIAALQRQLQQYRNGVNCSVDRRVRNIIQAYSEMDLQKGGKEQVVNNNININYNMTKKFNKENGVGLEEIVCSKCGELQSTIDKQKQTLEKQAQQLEEMRKIKYNENNVLKNEQNEMNKLKQQAQHLANELAEEREYMRKREQQFHKAEENAQIQYQNLLKQHQLALDELHGETLTGKIQVDESRRQILKRNQIDDKENNMIKEIGDIVAELSSRNSDHQRSKMPRLSASRTSTYEHSALFSIKDSINRSSYNARPMGNLNRQSCNTYY